MQRLQSINPETATEPAKELLNTVLDAFGTVPNAAKVMANSPAVLESFLAFSQAMGNASIGEKLFNQVKLSTSESNSCDYCTSLLCAVAPSAGLTADDIMSSRTKNAKDSRTDAALKFSESVLENRGKVTDEELQTVRDAGFNEAEIVEIVASVVLGCFTNFLNNVADTELDIPKAEPVQACDSTHEEACCSNTEEMQAEESCSTGSCSA